MVPVPLSRLEPSRIDAVEDWPWLDQDVLRSSRSRQVCITSHFFRHQHPADRSNVATTLSRGCSGGDETRRR